MGISQEDIDNIVKDSADEGTAQDTGKDDIEVATRRKILEGFASHLSNIFATLTGGDVKVGFQSDDLAVGSEIGSVLPGDWFGFVVHLAVGGDIPTAHLIMKPVAALVAGKIMGQDPPETLEEAHVGALKEAAVNLMGAWATGLGEMLGTEVKPAGEPEIIDGDVTAAIANIEGISSVNIHVCKFSISIGDTDGEYILVVPENPMKEIVMAHPDFTAPAPEGDTPVATEGEAISEEEGPTAQEVSVEKAVFQEFDVSTQIGEPSQIDLLLDVELTVSVELGRKQLAIKDVLEMVPGSLLELEKLAGEPVDLMVNGKLFAYGEVVVIDENFGVRISSIVSPQERLEKLK